jgi:hypothetical protein
MTEAVEQTRSFGDIAEYLERTFKDKQTLERRLIEVLEENKRLKSRAIGGRHEAELALRERLLKDEFERKTQALQLEMNKERRQLVECVEKLKKELAGCFCRQVP